MILNLYLYQIFHYSLFERLYIYIYPTLKGLNQILLDVREIRFVVEKWRSVFIFLRENSRVLNGRLISPRTSSRRGFTRVSAANGILIAKSILNDRVIFDSGLALWSSLEKGAHIYIHVYLWLWRHAIYSRRINIYQSSREHDVVLRERGNRCLNAVERFMAV